MPGGRRHRPRSAAAVEDRDGRRRCRTMGRTEELRGELHGAAALLYGNPDILLRMGRDGGEQKDRRQDGSDDAHQEAN